MTSEVKKLGSLLEGSRRICVVSHVNPDGDAVGSAVALSSYIRETLGKDVTVVLPTPWTEQLDFLAASEGILVHSQDPAACESAISAADLLVCLDFNSVSRSGGLEPALRSFTGPRALIDHHLAPDREFFPVCISEIEISSACELLYRVLVELAGSVDALPLKTATALMTGMTTDTNNFANSTYPSTLEMASALLRRGVDRDDIVLHLFSEHRECRLRALGRMLQDMKILPGGIAYMILDAATIKALDIREGDTEAFVNQPLAIADVRMSIFLKESGNYFRVSVRSKKGTSAFLMARLHFHGGGHEQASGGRLYFPEDIREPSQAARYIEDSAARFLQEEASDNK